MLFTEERFFVFFAVVFGVYWAMGADASRKRWLLAASWLFYGAWDWRFLSLLGATTMVDYAAGLALDAPARPHRRAILAASLAFNIGLLGIFKYYDFFVTSAQEACALIGLPLAVPLLSLALPAGISFYTFQSMSYTIDVYRGMRAERRFTDYALFVSFFPQLVAGPIVRAADFLPQLASARTWADVDVRAALTTFLIGFVKKAVIADNVAPVADAWFADPHAYTAASGWSAVLLYNIQLYCDFSGYSDMAIGAAALLGYRLNENFRFPYLATSPLDYWRRWHISFATWLRDYVYIPLGGSRGGAVRARWNILLTLLLSGLWHGAGWHYVVFGGLHGIAILNEREWRQTTLYARIPPRVRALGGFLFMQGFGTISRILFRAPTLTAAGPLLAVCLTGVSPGTTALPPWGWFAWAAMLGAQLAESRGWTERLWRAPPAWAFGVLYALGWAAALVLRAVEYRPFVYFQF